jgi:hypothetical protein
MDELGHTHFGDYAIDFSVRLSNYEDAPSPPGERLLRPYEVVVYQY